MCVCVCVRCLTLALSTHKYLLNFKKFSKNGFQSSPESNPEPNRPNLCRLGCPSTHIRHRFNFLANALQPLSPLTLFHPLSFCLSFFVAFAFSYLDYNFFHFTYECVRWLGWPSSRLFSPPSSPASSSSGCSVVWLSTCQFPFSFSFPQKQWKSQRNPFRRSRPAFSRSCCSRLRKSNRIRNWRTA